MPTFAYKCEDCGTKYEIFHKVREVIEDVICPQCNSRTSKKLISAVSIGGFSNKSLADMPLSSCATGQCSTGACPYN